MKCSSCGADFASDQLRCPYCSAVNEQALALAKELQAYDKDYEETRDDLIENGSVLVLKKVTLALGIVFFLIVVLFASYNAFYSYRYAPNSKYQVTGERYEKNKKMLKQYMDNKEYIRAYTLAAITDPTEEYFTYYPEYANELQAIYNYSLILCEIKTVMEDMDNGDNYRSFTPNQAISFEIFYGVEQSEVKQELQAELESYLRNLYRLTDAEIEQLRTCITSEDFTMDGEADYEKVSKERMVAYYGK